MFSLTFLNIVGSVFTLSVPVLSIKDLSDDSFYENETLENIREILFVGLCFGIVFDFFVSLGLLKFTYVIGLKSLKSSNKTEKLIKSGSQLSGNS